MIDTVKTAKCKTHLEWNMKSNLKSRRKTKRRQSLSGKAIFVLAVLGSAVLFMLYVGLFQQPRQRLVRGVRMLSGTMPEVVETAAPAPTAPQETLPPFDLTSWELKLANANNLLSEDYAPPELMEIADGQSVDSRIATPLRNLIGDAKQAGYTSLYLCSGYRDYDTQYSIYWTHIWDYMNSGYTQEEAEALTRVAVNPPGASEHQLGTTVDILEYYGQDMEPYIGGSGLMLWMEEHCTDYGFIIRYPADKTDITGVEYEPWHLRYVGVEAAKYITEKGLCLEEFLALYQ